MVMSNLLKETFDGLDPKRVLSPTKRFNKP